jgi:hypothetical protein
VIEAPAITHARIQMVTRTTDIARKGVPHDPMPEIGLNRPGVFADLASTEASLWTPRNVTHLGTLPPEVFALIEDRFC